MRILHITDSHGTVKSPEGRRDIYYVTFLKKLYELGFVCKKAHIDMVIHTGDLFHTARVSNKFAGQVSEMIKAMGVPFYVVPGNHDIEGYTTDTIDQTMLGLLSKTGVVNLLDREHPIRVTDNSSTDPYTIAISGQEYYAHIDEGNPDDFDMQQDEADFNILAIHGYIADTPQHPDIKCTMVQDVITNADVILTGHYHRAFEWNGNDLDIYNPGSMMRVEQTEYNKTHIPQYGILDVCTDESGSIVYDYRFYTFKVAQPSTTVFDYDSKYKQRIASITLDGFKNSLANTMATLAPTSDIVKIIEDLGIQNSIEGTVQKTATDIYNITLQAIPDEFEAQPGYIEKRTSSKIKSVTLENFQSHAHTKIDFHDGLNIIVGESNNGKTAIIRAIIWVIDNQPLGTDFIMAGEDTCVVRIDYDDGTYIERGRTRKDTGYYKVGYYDENGNFKDQTYRGFTNAIPVEVANIHQMPKVNITKDIETHLNVLSQLDAPFLITESSQVKAAAIGRITGTHVIDAAVKDTNKKIRSNKVLIKDVDKSIKDTESQISALPDVSLMEKVLTAYNTVIASIKASQFVIQKLESYQDEIEDIDRNIAGIKEEYSKCRVLMSIQQLVDKATATFKEVKFLDLKLEELSNIKIAHQLYTDTLKTNRAQVSMLPIINHANELYLFVSKVSKYVGEKKMTGAEEIITRQKLDVANSTVSLTTALIKYIDAKKTIVSNIDNFLSDYRYVEGRIKEVKKSATSYRKQIKAVTKQIAEVEKEKLQLILNEGICPCCGQPITSEEHAIHVNEFMEGQKVG